MPPDDHEANPWTTLSTRPVYDNPWIAVREDQVIRPDGQPGIYGVVHFKNRAIGVLPVEENGDVWLVGQYRYTFHRYSWEVPEGGANAGETEEAAAARELREETGLVAGHLERVPLTVHLSNSVTDEAGVVFRATQLVRGPSAPEGTERLRVQRVDWPTTWSMLQAGAITDSLSIVAILYEALRRGHPVG